MKNVKINAYQIGLLMKRGVYQGFLTEGNYWLWGKEVLIYDLYKPFVAPVELNILLQDKALAEKLQVVEVRDHEIALQFENGYFKDLLTVGRYTFWKVANEYQFVIADISKPDIDETIGRNLLAHKLLAPYVRTYTVENYEKALLFMDGKYMGLLDSGVYHWFKNPIPIYIVKADIRQQQIDVNGQEILTKDKAALRINAYALFKVADIEKALLENKDYDKQLYALFQLALREFIGAVNFDELLEKKETISAAVLNGLQLKAAMLGVQVIELGIRDIILPGDVKDIMNQVLVAEKKAQANIIMRREETASTRSLLNTAKLMEENTMLWKLKEMEYVEKIADKISTITVNNSGVLSDQLKQLFIPGK